MTVTFGDGAFDAYVDIASRIPEGYTVALLARGEDVPNGTDLVPTMDVRFVSADRDGVTYLLLDTVGEVVDVSPQVRPWHQIDRIHVY